MWAQGAVRIGEPFLLDSFGTPAIPPSWPFELAIWGTYAAGGHVAVSIALAILAGLAFALLASTLGPSASPGAKSAAFVLCAAAALVVRYRFSPRPEVIAYALFAAALALAHAWARAPSWGKLAGLASVFAFWMPVHLSWMFGALLVAVPLALRTPAGSWRAATAGIPSRIFAAILAAVFAWAAWRGLSFGWAILAGVRSGGAPAFFAELQPTWTAPRLAWPYAAASLVLLAGAAGARGGRPRRLVVWLVAALFGLAAARNVAFGLLGQLATAIEGVSGAFDGASNRALRSPWVAGAAAVALLALRGVDPLLPWGVGVRWELFPRSAAAFVKDQRLPSPVFNAFDIGGYVDFAWGGDPKTFVDGRVFDQTPAFQDSTAIETGPDPGAVLDRRGIRTVATRALFDDSGRVVPLVHHLTREREAWRLVHASDAMVYVRRSEAPGLGELPAAAVWAYVLWEIRVQASEHELGRPHLGYSRALALLNLGDVAAARSTYDEAVARHPECAAAYAALGERLREP